jgi:hypothetical protein
MMAQVKADDSLREDLIAVVHGFGAPTTSMTELDARRLGSVTRLLNLDERDPITGIPRMSAVPVSVQPWTPRGG